MAAVRVSSPDGVAWAVRRRWIPHREGRGIRERLRRRKGPRLDGLEGLDFGIDIEAAAVVLVLVGLLVASVLFGWPLLLLGLDLAWLVLVVIGGTLGRVVLRRPWRVEAAGNGERHDWYVAGFRAAGRRRDDLANAYRHGASPHRSADRELPD